MMEGLDMNNIGNQKNDLENKGFLSEPSEEEIKELEFSRERMVPLEEGEALSGGRYDVLKMRNLSVENDEDTPIEAEEIPEYVEDVAKMMLPVLQISISRGMAGGWDSKANMPTKDFIEIEGADLEKAVKNIHEPSLKRKEECMVYELIKNEISAQTEQERIIRDALIKRASRYCPN